MDRAERSVRRWPAVAATVLLGLVAAVWAILPDGGAARIERHARCYDPAALPPVETLTGGRKAVRLRVLLWNVEGLPWPIRSGREPKLAAIADWLAKRRNAGLGPDILILHKAFTPEASRIATAAGYANIIPGPALGDQRQLPTIAPPAGYAEAARWWKGEGIGKWLDGGLYVATDLPVIDKARDAFGSNSCAGYDCLSNKGGLALRVAVPGAPEALTLFNTHRNSREPAKVGIARAEAAHLIQTRENDALLAAFGQILPGTGRCPAGAEGPKALGLNHGSMTRDCDPSVTPSARHLPVPGRIDSDISPIVPRDAGGAMIAAGDFNNYRAGDKTGRFANDPAFRLAAKGPGFAARAAPMTDTRAWTDAYDLLGFRSSGALRVEPLAVATLFDGKNGPVLSDHAGQYVVFRLSWRPDAAAMPIAVSRCGAWPHSR